eukprot:jgi/Chlat1/3496/Chrsp23S03683
MAAVGLAGARLCQSSCSSSTLLPSSSTCSPLLPWLRRQKGEHGRPPPSPIVHCCASPSPPPPQSKPHQATDNSRLAQTQTASTSGSQSRSNGVHAEYALNGANSLRTATASTPAPTMDRARTPQPKALNGELSKESSVIEGAEEKRKNHLYESSFVHWFRDSSPYIRGHHGSTMVVVMSGDLVAKDHVVRSVLKDIALLHGLGVNIVLVAGAQTQIDSLLRSRGVRPTFVGPYRVTDKAALDAAMEAAGRIRVDMEAQLSTGYPIPALRRHGASARWSRSMLSVASGNYVFAKRRGVIDGVDFHYTGEVKRVDASRLRERIDSGAIVMLSNLGYSSAGEVLNCNTIEVATAAASGLKADKLIILVDGPCVEDDDGKTVSWMTLPDAEAIIAQDAMDSNGNYASAAYPSNSSSNNVFDRPRSPQNYTVYDNNDFRPGARSASPGFNASPSRSIGTVGTVTEQDEYVGIAVRRPASAGSNNSKHPVELAAAVHACRNGVQRVHLLDGNLEGAMLLELYTMDGVGTMVSLDKYEGTRPAEPRDVAGIMALLEPLQKDGTLLWRSREALVAELPCYTVVERDGHIIACAALMTYSSVGAGEVGAFAVSKEKRGEGLGDSLLDYLEQRALDRGLKRMFLLTTRTADWFCQRGFEPVPKHLVTRVVPPERLLRMHPGRNSQVFVKDLTVKQPPAGPPIRAKKGPPHTGHSLPARGQSPYS